MAFTTPRTWVTGELVTATMMQQQVSDNVSDLDARTTFSSAAVLTEQTETSTSYDDLATAGPAVTVTTGTQALVALYCRYENSSSNVPTLMAFAISGATTVAANENMAIGSGDQAGGEKVRVGATFPVTGLTPGSNTFTAKYRVDSGTGTFADRRIIVWPGNKLS
jgi:hypothetical protein